MSTNPRREWFEYQTADKLRYLDEGTKSKDRSEFERDRARVVHSVALRRLGAKTQVLGPSQNDFVRTRLTHSLEVAQVGRSFASLLGCDPDIVDAACLSHDLGHPPFGHNGEKALDECASQIGGFEANAQTFRILTRLEPKVYREDGFALGLNLTRAVLDATMKYPWGKGDKLSGVNGEKIDSQNKYGVYSDDLETFAWMRQGVSGSLPSLEAQVMNQCDDIAYSVHDFEDAVITGYCKLEKLEQERELRAVIDTGLSWYKSELSVVDLEKAAERLFSFPQWVRSYDASYKSRARMKNLTSQLIGKFCDAIIQETRDNSNSHTPLGRYEARLVVPRATKAEVLLMKSIAAHYVMHPRQSQSNYQKQKQIIHQLVDKLYSLGASVLEPQFGESFAFVHRKHKCTHTSSEADYKLRVIIDQVACLTDISIHQWYNTYCADKS